MTLIHRNSLTVRVGDLVTGYFCGQPNQSLETSSTYFPLLDWNAYTDAQLLGRTACENRPLYVFWR